MNIDAYIKQWTKMIRESTENNENYDEDTLTVFEEINDWFGNGKYAKCKLFENQNTGVQGVEVKFENYHDCEEGCAWIEEFLEEFNRDNKTEFKAEVDEEDFSVYAYKDI